MTYIYSSKLKNWISVVASLASFFQLTSSERASLRALHFGRQASYHRRLTEKVGSNMLDIISDSSTSLSIVLSTGGTGGHVFPALSLAAELKKNNYKVKLVTDTRGAAYQDSKYFDAVDILDLPKARGLLGKIRQGLSVLGHAAHLVVDFWKNKPDLVVGFGGYTSAPVVVAAVLARVPVIIHEQNAVLGRVNRIMGLFARKIALGMPVTRHANPRKSVYVGNPVRQEIIAAKRDTVDSDSFRVFIFGGSQGADLFARIVPKAIALLGNDIQKRLVLSHQVRDEILQQTKSAYDQTKATVNYLQPFFRDMPDQLAQADLVICRAGAMTVTELAIIGRPAIFVPLKIAMDNHQYWNVKPLVDAHAADIILEDDFTAAALAEKMSDLINSSEKRQSMSKKVMEFAVFDAAEKFAQLIQSELKDKGIDKFRSFE